MTPEESRILNEALQILEAEHWSSYEEVRAAYQRKRKLLEESNLESQDIAVRIQRLDDAYDEVSGARSEGNSHCEEGFEYTQSGKWAEAIKSFDVALQWSPGLARAYQGRGFAKCMLGEYAAAVHDYDAAVRFEPDNASFYSGRARAHEALGQEDLAKQDRSVHDRMMRKVFADQTLRDAIKEDTKRQKKHDRASIIVFVILLIGVGILTRC